MTLKENYYIKAGDQCIKFLGEDDVEYILEPGLDPRTGTDIVIHPTTGEVVTAGHEVIQEGDRVITVPLDTGDWAALKPAWTQETYCKPIIKWVHDVSPDPNPEGSIHEGERQYYAYDVHLSETFYRVDHDMNITLYFDIHDNEWRYGYLDNRFPMGAVYFGFGYYDGSGEPSGYGGEGYGPSPDVDWFWCQRNPYLSVRGNPFLHFDELDTGVLWNRPRLCYMDALQDNVCNQSRCTNTVSPLPSEEFPHGQPINMIHVHISCAGSLYYGGFTRSRLHALDVCRQVPSDCTTRCYGGRNIYPPIPPYDIMDNPEDWEEYLEEWP